MGLIIQITIQPQYINKLKYLKGYYLLIVLNLLLVFLAIIPSLLLIPISKNLPEAFSSPDLLSFLKIAFYVIVIYIFKGIFTFYQNYLTGYISVKASSDIRKDLYKKYLFSDSLIEKRSGKVITLIIDDINKIKEMIFSFISEFIPSFITLFFTIGYIFYLNWLLSIFVLLMTPAMGFFINLFTKLIKDKSELVQNKISESYSFIHENIINFIAIKVFRIENMRFLEFEKVEDKNNLENTHLIKLISLQPSVIGIIQVTGICFVATYSRFQMLNNKMTLSELLSFATALSLTIEPVIFLTKSMGIISKALPSVKNISNFESNIKVTEKNNKKIDKLSNYNIELINLNFSYNTKFLFKENINCLIEEGKIFLISADNGKGKSTLIKIILGIYKNFYGDIKIGNQNINDLDQDFFLSSIKACFTDAFLFHGSISDNILLNNINIDEKEFMEVCKITLVKDFVETFSEKYDYQIGEQGNKLSSGQKQKVAIARAIISKPKILILDEATSAMDLESEAYIYKEIRSYLPESTIIIINHRKESVKFIDRILKL